VHPPIAHVAAQHGQRHALHALHTPRRVAVPTIAIYALWQGGAEPLGSFPRGGSSSRGCGSWWWRSSCVPRPLPAAARCGAGHGGTNTDTISINSWRPVVQRVWMHCATAAAAVAGGNRVGRWSVCCGRTRTRAHQWGAQHQRRRSVGGRRRGTNNSRPAAHHLRIEQRRFTGSAAGCGSEGAVCLQRRQHRAATPTLYFCASPAAAAAGRRHSLPCLGWLVGVAFSAASLTRWRRDGSGVTQRVPTSGATATSAARKVGKEST